MRYGICNCKPRTPPRYMTARQCKLHARAFMLILRACDEQTLLFVAGWSEQTLVMAKHRRKADATIEKAQVISITWANPWRSRRDSNPRCRFCPHTPLAGEHLRPLGHDSSTAGILADKTRASPLIPHLAHKTTPPLGSAQLRGAGPVRPSPAPDQRPCAGRAPPTPCTSRRSRRRP